MIMSTQGLEVLRIQINQLTAPKQLFSERQKLVSDLRAFTNKHKTPFGSLYLQNGRGQRLQENQSMHFFGLQWKMCSPTSLVILLWLYSHFCLACRHKHACTHARMHSRAHTHTRTHTYTHTHTCTHPGTGARTRVCAPPPPTPQ